MIIKDFVMLLLFSICSCFPFFQFLMHLLNEYKCLQQYAQLIIIPQQQHNKNMNSTQGSLSKTDRLQLFIQQAKRNGYLQQIKQLHRQGEGQPNVYDITYRKKATAYYGKKISKPFKLEDQPEYRRQLRFNSDFKAFVRSIPVFQSIKQQPIFSLPPMTDLQNQIHSQTLTYNPTQKCEVSPENIRKRKVKLETEYHSYKDTNIFPTKINFSNKLRDNRMDRQQNQSRIQIEINSGFRSNNQLSPQHSPFKFVRTKTNKTNNSKNKKTNRTLNLSKSRSGATNSIHGSQSFYINENTALINLNRLVGTDSKQKNFRVPKQKLHEILDKKYGNDVIINFFNLQAIQDFDGIIKFIREIASAQDVLAQLLTFLTFDYNQDGVITQDEILRINDLIDANNPITEDIRTLVAYANLHPDLKCQPDLPAHFVRFPSYKQYLKITENVNDIHKQKIRGIFRLFSLKMQSQGAEAEEISKNQKIAEKQMQFIKKKNVRINFEHFQKAFSGRGHPQFIRQVIGYLIGKDHRRSQQISPGRRMSVSIDKRRLRRMTTATLDPRIFHSNLPNQDYQNHISRAKQLLETLYQDRKGLNTVQFD